MEERIRDETESFVLSGCASERYVGVFAEEVVGA